MDCWTRLKSSGWVYPTVVISIYGFFANCRPAEPFVTPYLITHKNISEEVLTNSLFPIWTYSYLVILVPVFLLTDFLRYKPLIVLQGLFLVANGVLLCFVPGLPAMTVLQVIISSKCSSLEALFGDHSNSNTSARNLLPESSNMCTVDFYTNFRTAAMLVNFAVVTSTEVAYLSYIYSVIPAEMYQKATGYLRSAMLVGYTFGATLGQLLVSLAGIDYFYINVITLGTVSFALLVSFWLPMPQRGIFFKGEMADAPLGSQSQREDSAVVEEEKAEEGLGSGSEKTEGRGCGLCSSESVAHAGQVLWKSFKDSYSSKHLIYWSLWWALATAGYGQIFNYIQLMWDHIEPSATSAVYNGGVEAVCTLVGAAAAFSVGYIKVTWTVWGELALGLFSALGAGAVFLMALTNSIWVCYAGYVVFKASYMLLITITTFQIAANLAMECYALTFGINTFAAISLQTIVTLIVVDESALGLDIVTQFLIYGSYYATISVVFLIRGTYTACSYYRCSGQTQVKEQNTSRSSGEVISAEQF